MFRRSWTEKVKEKAPDASELALKLAQDKKFRKRLLSALDHGAEAGRRVRDGRGLAGAARRLATDETLQEELRKAREDLQEAYARLDAKQRSRRLRRILTLGGMASLTALPQVRERLAPIIETALRKRQHLQRIATASGNGRGGLRPNKLEALTKEELYAKAREVEIPGRSEMSKEELITALRASE